MLMAEEVEVTFFIVLFLFLLLLLLLSLSPSPPCHVDVRTRTHTAFSVARISMKGGTQPPTAVGKMEAQSEHAHIAYTFLHVWAPICMLSRCLVTKISASELRRKSIKSALLVG